MDALFLIVPLGVILSLIAFFFFEKRAIAAKKSKEASGLPAPSVEDFYEKFQRYESLTNMIGFFIAAYVITLFLVSLKHDPNYGLMHALSYIFATTFIGTLIIFGMKLKKSILIQVFATFLYGTPHILAASLAFLTRYLIG